MLFINRTESILIGLGGLVGSYGDLFMITKLREHEIKRIRQNNAR